MTTAVLTSKGQITIPLPVRSKLGVEAGDRIEFIELGNGQFGIIAATEDISSLKGIVGKPKTPVTIEDMNRAIVKRGAGK
ncbi:MAG: AbrB family transcriptional regulator [Gallionellales bacterium RIFCSPLOWO2_12_FULL_59_22]|nr:MAG: AbrB family transcriptional regulator [Gallionellales bacterium RIFCSPLOWO2_02_FULL_59_110]OGT05062.1 MAG: AbrB family transcriptional regulator [Gallionellales bacterium RIFCSPLOWO2_02_58_13]OGT14560.1 MAG: AbrB family transcriptional regulator [Gallionellales bacterium RIFCSPLOWO2_12_FULL_59_22]